MADSWTTAISMKEKAEVEEEKRKENEEDLPQSFLDGIWFASTVLMQQGKESERLYEKCLSVPDYENR